MRVRNLCFWFLQVSHYTGSGGPKGGFESTLEGVLLAEDMASEA